MRAVALHRTQRRAAGPGVAVVPALVGVGVTALALFVSLSLVVNAIGAAQPSPTQLQVLVGASALVALAAGGLGGGLSARRRGIEGRRARTLAGSAGPLTLVVLSLAASALARPGDGRATLGMVLLHGLGLAAALGSGAVAAGRKPEGSG